MKTNLWFFPITLLTILLPNATFAQIIPEANSVGTQVIINGNETNITGGQTSLNGSNLFHSLLEFNLTSDQIANFISHPSIINILTRINGGNPSIINGTINLTGGNSNLFLMNPSGIIFGSTAVLNVPASFTATTASHIGIGDNWFNSTGIINPSNGTVNSFINPTGSIINQATLSPGADLTLIAKTIQSTGTLRTQSNLIVSTNQYIQLKAPGQILTLEIDQNNLPPTTSFNNSVPLNLLPELLTGDLQVNQIQANNATLSANNNIILNNSQISTNFDLNLIAQNQVKIRDSITNPFIANIQGNLTIQSHQGIDILALNSKTPFNVQGNTTLISDGIISTDAHFTTGGNFTVTTLSGQPGNLISIYDPVINVGGNFSIGNYTGASLQVTAGGNIDYGTVVINALDTAINPTNPVFTLTAGGTITGGNVSSTFSGTGLIVNFQAVGDITVADINTTIPLTTPVISIESGTITLTSTTGNITTGNLTSSASNPNGTAIAGNITLNAARSITTNNINSTGLGSSSGTGGTVNLITSNTPPSNITFTSIDSAGSTTGGNINILATGLVTGTGTITGTSLTVNTIADGGTAGTVTIRHDGGPNNLPFTIGSATLNGLTGGINAGGGAIASATVALPATTSTTNLNTNIAITGINSAPSISAIPTNTIFNDQTVTYTYSTLAALVTDINQDNLTLSLQNITTNGTLTKNGVVVTGSTTISSGDTLVYTPASGASGTVTIFNLAGSDIVSNSNPNQPANVIIQTRLIPTPTPTNTPTSRPTNHGDPGNEINTIFTQPRNTSIVSTSTGTTQINPGTVNSESNFTRKIEQYYGLPTNQVRTVDDTRRILQNIEEEAKIKPAVIYIAFYPAKVLPIAESKPDEFQPSPTDELEVIMITSKGFPFRKRLYGVTREQVIKVAQQFIAGTTNFRRPNSFLKPSQQLYQWIITPLLSELKAREIDNLLFIPDTGLRSIPYPALHDGQKFIIEDYSVGMSPSISLTDTRYVELKSYNVLAMGASEFPSTNLNPLPAVPVELKIIAEKLWKGNKYLNQDFTINQLKTTRQQTQYGIIHLATHGEFKPGSPDKSYIQFWQNPLTLNNIRNLGLKDPQINLLVLSACRTALGDNEAELGFAGLAVQAGVKSAIASLWYVSDEATLGLMAEFYTHLKTARTKSEAIRLAQLDMIKKRVKIQNGKLTTPTLTQQLPSPLSNISDRNLDHPYFWSAFTIIGNPW